MAFFLCRLGNCLLIDPFVVIKLSSNCVKYMLCCVCGICFVISLVVFNSAINTLLCRLMRRFYRKWLRGDLTGTYWLNLFATDYKIRFGRFQANIFLQFSNGVLFLATYSGYCCILFVIGQPVPSFKWLSWSWVPRDYGASAFC